MWRLTYKWAKRTHPNKSKHWVIARYFGGFNPSRRDRWVFGDRDSGAYLLKFAWTKIVRHQMVTGRRVPGRPGPDRLLGRAAAHAADPRWQRDRCACCRRSTAAARSAGSCCCTPTANRKAPTNGSSGSRRPARRSAKQRDHRRPGRGTPDEPAALRLIHTHCRRRHADRATAGASTSATCPRAFRACLSRVPGKRARPVLRGYPTSFGGRGAGPRLVNAMLWSDAERRAGQALRKMTDDEGLSAGEAADWCGSGVTTREITRLRRLQYYPQRVGGRQAQDRSTSSVDCRVDAACAGHESE